MATAVFKYLIKHDKLGVEKVHLFCDRCGDQNNNRTVVLMLSYATAVLDIKEITLKFLITGHSQNENDTAHSIIETATRHKTIHTTDQWEMAITMAFKTHTPLVEVFDHTSVYDFKSPTSIPPLSSIWKTTLKRVKMPGKNCIGQKLCR